MSRTTSTSRNVQPGEILYGYAVLLESITALWSSGLHRRWWPYWGVLRAIEAAWGPRPSSPPTPRRTVPATPARCRPCPNDNEYCESWCPLVARNLYGAT